MRYLNTSSLNWGYLYHQTEIIQFKIQFLNEMFSEIFVNIIKGELCHLYKSNIFDQFQ
jgi:predicted SprT family Zn-dependent metalloprotease